MGLSFFLAALGAGGLNLRPTWTDVAPYIAFGLMYVVFAVVFALSFGMDAWLDHQRMLARGSGDRRPGSHVS